MNIDDATLPNLGAAERAGSSAAPRSIDVPEAMLATLIVTLSGVIFAFDVVTPADHVSVSFLYAIPLFVAVFGRAQPVYLYAAAATVLSTAGIFIQPPDDILPAAYYANRAIAVTVLWIVAGLVATRKKAEALIRSGFEEEKRKSEHRRRFLDVLSHEIGTSLTTIDGQAFRLRKLAGGHSTGDVASRADKIRNAVRHIETMVRRVQLASEAGQRALQPRLAPVDLRSLIGDAVQALRDDALAARIEIDIKALPAAVQADCYMLRQVIDNLLSNAVKYSPAGAPIRIVGCTGPGRVEIAVIDRGRGVPKDEQAMLFDPYYRASNSRGVHGAGIGLYVCERFVTSHGGTIDIRSTLGEGTTVTVRIPVAARTSNAATPSAKTSSNKTSSNETSSNETSREVDAEAAHPVH